MGEKITVSLDRSEWIELAKFLSKKCGEMVNIVPVINLLTELGNSGIKTSEME